MFIFSGFGDSEVIPPSNRAVGAMRAIRGNGGNPIRPAEPNDLAQGKQIPQLRYATVSPQVLG